jgi:lipopolysaccharide biosynthesis glycosyltransferase
MTNVVYQAYGRQDVIRQSIFSAASLLKKYPEFSDRIVFYSDHAEQLRHFFGKDERISVVEISAGELAAWGGPHKFIHRIKLEILLDASRKWSGNILYLDGDTIFIDSAENILGRLRQNYTLMHVREYTFKTAQGILPRKIAKFAQRTRFTLPTGQVLRFTEDSAMWNAGVIGVPSDQRQLIERALQLTDVLYEKYQKHVMEQLAVSYCLSESSEVMPTDDVILHYWDNKPFYQEKIDQALAKFKNLNQLLRDFPDITQWVPPVTAPRQSIWKRFSRKLLKN